MSQRRKAETVPEEVAPGPWDLSAPRIPAWNCVTAAPAGCSGRGSVAGRSLQLPARRRRVLQVAGLCLASPSPVVIGEILQSHPPHGRSGYQQVVSCKAFVCLSCPCSPEEICPSWEGRLALLGLGSLPVVTLGSGGFNSFWGSKGQQEPVNKCCSVWLKARSWESDCSLILGGQQSPNIALSVSDSRAVQYLHGAVRASALCSTKVTWTVFLQKAHSFSQPGCTDPS